VPRNLNLNYIKFTENTFRQLVLETGFLVGPRGRCEILSGAPGSHRPDLPAIEGTKERTRMYDRFRLDGVKKLGIIKQPSGSTFV
jgi:hypothetical protein